MPYELKYFGATTGRDSGGGGWNCQNIPKGEVAGVDIRKLIEAPEGKTLIICDLAQIEARCLPYLAKDFDLLKLIESGLDVYEAHARATMGYTDPRPLKEVDPKLRQVAKARVLGAGYGVGAAKFQLVAKIMAGLDITLQEAQETVQAYRDSNPKIVAYWKKFDRELRIATDPNDRELIAELPSKRVLTYRNVRRQAGGIIGLLPRLGKMMDTNLYGAKIVENLCQAFARDVFMDRVMALDDAGYEILLRVHDEVVLLVPEPDAETHRAAVEKLMSTPPSWCSDLPLGAEAIISKQYTK
jgi:DNA polymerase